MLEYNAARRWALVTKVPVRPYLFERAIISVPITNRPIIEPAATHRLKELLMPTLRWMIFAVLVSNAGCFACGSSDAPANGSAPPADVCANETRAKPYSAGMTFEGTHGVVIALMDSVPAPPVKGDNTWTLDIKDSSGAEITDATITTKQTMVDHGHPGAKIINVTSEGGGTYEARPVNFNMTGYWETMFTITTPTVEDTVDVKMCIP
jgi:hypothetical protein